MTTSLMLFAVSATPGTFLGWGPVTVSLGNLIVIVAMILLFVAALVVPFPKDEDHR